VNDLLIGLGHDVIVANPRKLRMIFQNDSKCDRFDAEQLARVARLDPKLLHPIRHRERSARVDLAKVRSRDMLVSTRTSLINHVRGVLKSFGARVGAKSAPSFHGWVESQIPEELRDALRPILSTLTAVGEQIVLLDKELERLAAEVYPETDLLRQVDRVGLHTAVRFVLTVEDPARIPRRFLAAATSVHTSVSARAGSSPGHAIPSCASPKLATATCDATSFNARSRCSGRSAKTLTCGVGACTLQNVATRQPRRRRSSRSHVSSPS